MKLIIAGSRGLIFPCELIEYIRQTYALRPSEIVSGGASGTDYYAEQFADKFGYNKKIFKANWNKYNKAAGPIRNQEMAEYADALLLIWDGNSRGSANMKSCMENLNKPIYEVILPSLSLLSQENIEDLF